MNVHIEYTIKNLLSDFIKKVPNVNIEYAYEEDTGYHIIELDDICYKGDKNYLQEKVCLRKELIKLEKLCNFDNDILLTSNCMHHNMKNLRGQYGNKYNNNKE